jgi:hypothetical protein
VRNATVTTWKRIENGTVGHMALDGRSYEAVLPGPLREAAPVRRLGSVRRTSHLDVSSRPGGAMMSPAAITGAARDLVTSAGGLASVAGEARLAIAFDDGGVVESVEHEPAGPSCAALVGARVGFGFRSSIKDLLLELDGSLLGLLVDDLSGAPAPSGYGAIRERIVLGLPDPPMPPGASGGVSQQKDVCAGWRAGGLPTHTRETGAPMPFSTPPVAPSLASDDGWAWHAMPALRLRQSRRIRRLDLWADGDRLMVDAMFRDSTVDPDAELTERVVHEYAVSTTLDRATRTVQSIHADPRSLPFPTDCPFAAGSADLILGQSVDSLRTTVRQVSRGPVSCTHLNDLFRTLADVTALVDLLPN